MRLYVHIWPQNQQKNKEASIIEYFFELTYTIIFALDSC